MRKWNKLLATVLAMVMVFGLTATAFADSKDAGTDTTTPTSDSAPADDTQKDDAAPADGEADPDTAPADGEADPDAAPADSEADPDAAPADGEADPDAAPADSEADPDAAPADPEPAAVTFTDVKEGDWFYEDVMKMAAAGIVNGYSDGRFMPGDAITWGAALKMVTVFVTGEEKAPVEGGDWASGYVAYAKEADLVEGDVDINAVITRVEVCQVLAKALKLEASTEESIFPDTEDGYVMALVALKVIDGNPDGTFDPDGALTRAAVCKILATVPEDVKNPADDATEPTEGEDDAEPTEGEDAAEPTEGEDDAEPTEGEDAAEPTEGDDAGKADDADKAAE